MEITGNFPRRACVLIRFSRVWLCDPMDRMLLCPFTTTEVLEGYPHCRHRPLCAGASFCLRFLLPALSAQSLRMPKDQPVQLRANSRPWSSPPGLGAARCTPEGFCPRASGVPNGLSPGSASCAPTQPCSYSSHCLLRLEGCSPAQVRLRSLGFLLPLLGTELSWDLPGEQFL